MLRCFFAAIILAVSPLVHADKVVGLLEKGKSDSAVYTFSPESGDLIAYFFKSGSKAGKTILSRCLNGMLCRIDEANLVYRENGPKKISEGASAVFEITSAREVYMESDTVEYDDPKVFKSRFGTLRITEDGKLIFNSKPVVNPKIEANYSINVVSNLEFDGYDLVLIENSGGTGCPGLYHFARIDKSGIKVSDEFGTCSNIFYIRMAPNNTVQVDMTGFLGPAVPEAEQMKALMTKHIFHYTKDGKVIEKS